MAARTPPATRWACTKCGREVTSGVESTIDPRYATGLCLHGKPPTEATPERVPLAAMAKAEAIVDQRSYVRAVKRARRKELEGTPLSANETAALARWRKERTER